MDTKRIGMIRSRVLLALEDMGGVCTRLRELEEEAAGLANLGDYEEDLQNWLEGAAETLREAWWMVQESRSKQMPGAAQDENEDRIAVSDGYGEED
jgi:hypothetical protein